MLERFQSESAHDRHALTPKEGGFLARYQPIPLSTLFAWATRSRHKPVQAEPEPFDEHMNGLA